VFYRVVDPYDYVLQSDHITPALERLVARSAVTVCAARDLDTILVARPELVGASSDAAERRERLRGDLVHGINQGLAALKIGGTGLGIEVPRVDVQASLPRDAVSAFNAVLTASQTAEQNAAKARTEAAQLTQTATGRPIILCRWREPRPPSGWPKPRQILPPCCAWHKPCRTTSILACCCASTANAWRRFCPKPVRSSRSIRATILA